MKIIINADKKGFFKRMMQLEDPKLKMVDLRDLLAGIGDFQDDGNILTEESAREQIENFSYNDLIRITSSVRKQLQEVTANAVPPQNGGSSSPPSQPSQESTPSPSGTT
jgi:hypothetical protein